MSLAATISAINMNFPGKDCVTRQSIGLALAGGAGWLAARSLIRRLRRFDFQDGRVLITGGSRGLGLLLARRLVEYGARVAICARDGDQVERARQELANRGGSVLGAPCDVSDAEQMARTVKAVRGAWGGVDVLINNAGVIQVGPAEEMNAEDFARALGVHFWGPLHATWAVLPEMRRRGQGRIVNIASIGGLVSIPHLLPYCASKFALVGLSQGLRAALRRHGIYVTTICPGTMRTGSHVNAKFQGQNEKEFAWFSVGASAPTLAMDARRAADQILRACRDGRALLTPSWPAKLLATCHALAPSLTADALGVVDGMLPRAGGIGSEQAGGADSRPGWLPAWLTRLGDEAARRNNELPAGDGRPANAPDLTPPWAT